MGIACECCATGRKNYVEAAGRKALYIGGCSIGNAKEKKAIHKPGSLSLGVAKKACITGLE
jgi:hypothetical protein